MFQTDSSNNIDAQHSKSGECLALGQLALDKSLYHSTASTVYQDVISSRGCSGDAASSAYMTSTECGVSGQPSCSQMLADQNSNQTLPSSACAHLTNASTNNCYSSNPYSSSHNLLDENGHYLPSPYAATHLLCTGSAGHLLASNDQHCKQYDTPNTCPSGRNKLVSVRLAPCNTANVYDVPQQRNSTAVNSVSSNQF